MTDQKKILVVDDDTDFAGAMQTLLETQGFSVVTASDSAEGFCMAVAESPDLMLLDVMMTYDNEGFEFAQKLHADDKTKKIPIIIVTGIRKAKNLPFKFEPDPEWLPVRAVLEKPIKAEELLLEVKRALEHK